jgi:hypothetical protein
MQKVVRKLWMLLVDLALLIIALVLLTKLLLRRLTQVQVPHLIYEEKNPAIFVIKSLLRVEGCGQFNVQLWLHASSTDVNISEFDREPQQNFFVVTPQFTVEKKSTLQ